LGIRLHPESAQFPAAELQVAAAVPEYPVAQAGLHEDEAAEAEQLPVE
jgi:hypothetical protein